MSTTSRKRTISTGQQVENTDNANYSNAPKRAKKNVSEGAMTQQHTNQNMNQNQSFESVLSIVGNSSSSSSSSSSSLQHRSLDLLHHILRCANLKEELYIALPVINRKCIAEKETGNHSIDYLVRNAKDTNGKSMKSAVALSILANWLVGEGCWTTTSSR